MKYDFDHLPNRRANPCEKWHKYAEDVIPMWIADMDFPSPEVVQQALRERVDSGDFGYPVGISGSPKELVELRQLIVERMMARYAWRIAPGDIIFFPGVITGFNLACHALAAPDGGVLVQTPVYTPILTAASNTGCLPQEMELTRSQDGRYTVDWQAFRSALDDQTRLFVLCNPHNPVGRVFSEAELSRMAEACLERGVVICSDEIHCDLVYPGAGHIPIASLSPEIAQNTITLMAPSKTFNLAGLQCSFAIIQNADLRRKYLAARQGLVPWVNSFGIAAAQAAYQGGQEWLDQLLDYLVGNREALVDYVQTRLPAIKVAKPEATYLAWLDCREVNIAGNPSEFFLGSARVALGDGQAFGHGGEGFVRLNFGCPQPLLMEALERMKTALEERNVL